MIKNLIKRLCATGTKSLLFGGHCILIHPFFVALAWHKLYGFPFNPKLWLAFFVHDLGYWGRERLDDQDGELHPELGAQIMHKICDKDGSNHWYNFSLYHSRFYAKRDNANPSRLCWADKYALCLTPIWLCVLLSRLSGEIHEYRELHSNPNNKYIKEGIQYINTNINNDYDLFQSFKEENCRIIRECLKNELINVVI